MPSLAEIGKYLLPITAGIGAAMDPFDKVSQGLTRAVSMRQAFQDREINKQRQAEADELRRRGEGRAVEASERASAAEGRAVEDQAAQRKERGRKDEAYERQSQFRGALENLPSMVTDDLEYQASIATGDLKGATSRMTEVGEEKELSGSLLTLLAERNPQALAELRPLIESDPNSFKTALQSIAPDAFSGKQPLSVEQLQALQGQMGPGQYASAEVGVGEGDQTARMSVSVPQPSQSTFGQISPLKIDEYFVKEQDAATDINARLEPAMKQLAGLKEQGEVLGEAGLESEYSKKMAELELEYGKAKVAYHNDTDSYATELGRNTVWPTFEQWVQGTPVTWADPRLSSDDNAGAAAPPPEAAAGGITPG